jgi:cell division protein FtsB
MRQSVLLRDCYRPRRKPRLSTRILFLLGALAGVLAAHGARSLNDALEAQIEREAREIKAYRLWEI